MAKKRRPPRGKKINPTLFVFCEGKTEEAYLHFLRREYRLPSINIDAKISRNNITDNYIKNYKQNKPTHEKDLDFLMYDLDVYEILVRLQKIENATLLLSNPCIELWFLLHYKNQTAFTESKYCCSELKKRNKQYKKGDLDTKLLEKLVAKRFDAIKRAKKLAEFKNPSSTIYVLIEYLEKLKKNQ